MGIFKTLVRVGLITTVGGGVAVLLAGPDRAAALVSQAQDKINSAIDSNIDDPVALRSQLRELEKQYPERIAQVRGDLAELQEQMRQLEREKAIAERVVALANRDLEVLEPMLEEAEQVAPASYGDGVRNVVSIRFDNRSYSLEQGSARCSQIKHTRVAYANRAADAAHDLIYLVQQSDQLDELLGQLETERSQFQAQLWQLDRQVDAIARNEKLIDMLEERKQTIEECSRYEVASLDQLVGKLAEVRVRQQAELDLLTGDNQRVAYEDVARMELESEAGFFEADASPVGIESLVLDGDGPRRR